MNKMKNFNTKMFLQEIVEYAYWLHGEEGIVLKIPDNDWLHDILLSQCGYENIILDNDALYEEFRAKVKEVDVEKLNKKIKSLFD